MSLYKRGGVWWSCVSVDGVRYCQSTGTGNRRQAELIEKRIKDELNLQRHHIKVADPNITVGKLIALFLASGATKPWHHDRFKALLPYWADLKASTLTRSIADDYRRHRHGQRNLTETTVNRDLQCLRHVLYWAADEGLIRQNPLARLRLARERRRKRPILALEDEDALLQACSPHLQRIVIAALDTGMRRGEILNQLWTDIDFGRELLWVTHSKTPEGEAREIPLTTRLFDLLWESREDQGLVFTFKGRPIQRIKTAWRAAISRSGIRPLRFHDLRHTFNTRLMEAGVMQEVRKALMGHSSGEDVHSIYTHVELPLKREAIRKLQEWVQTQQQNQKEKKQA